MNEKRKSFWAGLFLILGLALLILGIVWVKEIGVLKSTQKVLVSFPDVGGLRVGDPVDIAGVKKGRVAKLKLREHDVLVTLDIDRDVFLPEDSKIVMRNLSFLSGEKYIKIELGRSKNPYNPEKPFQGSYYDEFSIGNLTATLRRVNEVISKIDVGSVSDTLIKRIDELFKSSKRSLEVIERRSGGIDSLITALQKIAGNLDTLTVELRQGKGTLGKLLKEDKAYKEILSTNEELKSLIQDIKTHPERYFKIKIF